MTCNCLTESFLRSLLADEFAHLEKIISNEGSMEEAVITGRISMLKDLLKELNSRKKED